MATKLRLIPTTLYPIESLEEDVHLFADQTLFSNMIATSDFSRVLAKLQWICRKHEPMNLYFSIKSKHGQIPVVMVASYKDHKIDAWLYDLHQMSDEEMKKIKAN